MNRYFNLCGTALFFIVIFSISSCKDDNDENTSGTNASAITSTDATASTNTATTTTTDGQKPAALTGTLDTLWVDASEFKKLKHRKLVFSFTFRDPDTLTLYGWTCKGAICVGSYDTDPNIKLKKGQRSNTQYGPNVIFGNIVLQGNDVDEIQKKLVAPYIYVIFIPKNMGEAIAYDIYISSAKSFVKDFALEDTGFDANPSPPKIY